MIKEFIVQNWALIMILMAFAILLKTTIFLNRKTIRRMYVLIGVVFLLSVIVFAEFYLESLGTMKELRVVLMAIRYSATPVIISLIVYTLVKKMRWFVFIPAIVLAAVNLVSIFTGIVFSIAADNTFHRGPLGYLPFIVVGIYCVFLVYILFRQSNKQPTEIIPILFLCFAFATGLILPFVLGKTYSQIFCVTIVISLFVYYVFSILQLTEKDSLTGLLNRQAYYAAVSDGASDINALVSIDMNGLKTINDNEGHLAGDEALETLALCFLRAARPRQSVYRVGGDEFVIVCRRFTEDEIKQLVARIEKNVSETKYFCAVGYSYTKDGTKPIDELLKESDEKMYAQKALFYRNSGSDRRHHG